MDLGFDLWRDMLAVARCIERHEKVDAATLGNDTGFPHQRINVAALILEHLDAIKLVQTFGTSSPDFAEASATRHTQRWLRENQA